jgi:hypothetical protein
MMMLVSELAASSSLGRVMGAASRLLVVLRQSWKLSPSHASLTPTQAHEIVVGQRHSEAAEVLL